MHQIIATSYINFGWYFPDNNIIQEEEEIFSQLRKPPNPGFTGEGIFLKSTP
jgi:hypothetical protein